jgi:hypothetical protein
VSVGCEVWVSVVVGGGAADLAVNFSWQRPYDALPVAFVALTNVPWTCSVNSGPPISDFLCLYEKVPLDLTFLLIRGCQGACTPCARIAPAFTRY